MDIKRYIIIQAIKTNDNILIPIWDERIIFEKNEMYGNIIRLKDKTWKHFHSLVECMYDLKTKKIEPGIELDYFPSTNTLEFKIGETVLFETSDRTLADAKISKIKFKEYDLHIKRGRKLDKWWLDHFKNIQFDGDSLYAIKQWKPVYVLDNDIEIEWEHQLYHKS